MIKINKEKQLNYFIEKKKQLMNDLNILKRTKEEILFENKIKLNFEKKKKEIENEIKKYKKIIQNQQKDYVNLTYEINKIKKSLEKIKNN